MTAEQAEAILLAAYQAEVEYRRMNFTYDTFVYTNIKKVASYLTSKNPKFGMMLCGTCGNGKTTMVYAIQNALSYLRKAGMFEQEKERGFDVRVRIEDAKNIQRFATNAELSAELKRTSILAIEDMGREATEVLEYGNVLNPIIDLLEYRYNAQLFTVITTNLTAKEIREKYGTRIADRFNEMMNVIIFENKSYRI